MTQSYKYFILIYHIVVKKYQHENEKLQKMFDFYWYTLEKYKKTPARWVLMVCNISHVHTNSNMPSIKNMYIYTYIIDLRQRFQLTQNTKITSMKKLYYPQVYVNLRHIKWHLVKFTANINIPQSSFGNLKAKFYNYYSVLHIISCLWSSWYSVSFFNSGFCEFVFYCIRLRLLPVWAPRIFQWEKTEM